MESEKTIEIDVEKVLENIKSACMGQSSTIACHNCEKNYCCVDQVSIQISDREFDQVKPYITEEQKERARYELDNKRQGRQGLVYTCPFNNPTTGNCEIYQSRFVVCAGHGVVADNEDVCNTRSNTGDGGTMIVNPMNTIQIAANRDEKTKHYLTYLTNGRETDILDEFERMFNESK